MLCGIKLIIFCGRMSHLVPHTCTRSVRWPRSTMRRAEPTLPLQQWHINFNMPECNMPSHHISACPTCIARGNSKNASLFVGTLIFLISCPTTPTFNLLNVLSSYNYIPEILKFRGYYVFGCAASAVSVAATARQTFVHAITLSQIHQSNSYSP